MSERALATIRKIAEISTIEGKDRIVSYRVDGWWVTDSKDKYHIGDLVVYLEPDSWVPTDIAPFLSKGKEPREFEGVKGERLKTIKMGGVLSQGLLLAVDQVCKNIESELFEGLDITVPLGIKKWEKPIPACLAGQVRGNFPSEIPKTDAVRIQNVRDWQKCLEDSFEVTEKLHGSSCTFYLDNEGTFHVCSRNMDLKEDENNAYWKAAKQYDVEQRMRNEGLLGYAIQGELVGDGINGNQYKISGLDFFVFNVYNANTGMYLDAKCRTICCEVLKLKQVPEIGAVLLSNIQDMLKQAEGKSELNASEREGFVLKSQNDTSVIIKVISNKWLLKGGDEQ